MQQSSALRGTQHSILQLQQLSLTGCMLEQPQV